jgi:hypothetical protein
MLILGIALLLAITIAGLTQWAAVQSARVGNNTGAAFLLQTTSTPQPADQSEIGSTDGIVLMGGVIALIIFLPILLRYKHWARLS